MTNEEKALELSSINKYGFSVEESNAAYNSALEMARWKDEQLKEVCKRCEQHIIDSGKNGCAFRTLGNEYCWEMI